MPSNYKIILIYRREDEEPKITDIKEVKNWLKDIYKYP